MMNPAVPAPPIPLDPDYKPSVAIISLPADAPLSQIKDVIARDGGVILTNLVSHQDLADVEEELEEYQSNAPSTHDKALSIIPKETTVVPGLVGKSATMAKICSENPVLEGLRKDILEDNFGVVREEIREDNSIDPLLSISITLHIGHGAPRQRLHRDDNVHGIRHSAPFDLTKVSQFGCLIAATRTTQQNGATMFVPGSHLWDDSREPSTDEVCFAGKWNRLGNVPVSSGLIFRQKWSPGRR
jgi:swainsonine biosynthesis dioxygenase SwnH1/2